MEPKKTKYDTNPLDPDYVRQTEEVWGENEGGSGTREVKGATRRVASSSDEGARSNVYSEAPTRTFDTPPADSPYPSVFVPPTYSPPASQYQSSPYLPPQINLRPTSRPVTGIELPEKWAVMLPYAPYIGVVAALIELFLVPRKELKVRFHASQGLALHIVILAIQTLFSVIGAITNNSVGGSFFTTAATVFLIISMIRVWKGEPHRIAPIIEPAQWLNERISPRNKG